MSGTALSNPVSGYSGYLDEAVSCVIASGQTTSPIQNLGGMTPVGIYIPSSFTGTSISFKASADQSTSVPVNSTAGSALTITVSAGNYYALDRVNFFGIQFLQVVSNASEGAQRTLYLALRGF